MKESDWKKFKAIKEKAIERFCTQALDEFGAVISKTDEHAQDRYLHLQKLLKSRDKEMSSIFNEHSRYHAQMQLMAIRARGLADEALLAELSDEFRAQTGPTRFGQ